MDDKKLMKDKIEQKKLKGSLRKPKYSTRKLSIGLIYCMIGFILLESLTNVWADETDLDSIQNKLSVEGVLDGDVYSAIEDPIVDEEKSIFSKEQKQRLIAVDFIEAEIKKLEIEAEDKKALYGETFDVDEFINEIIAEKSNQGIELDGNGEEKDAVAAKSNKGPGIATRDAEGDIESGNIANDAPNAVHAFAGVQTGGDLNWVLSDVTGQQFKPIQGIKAYFQWFEKGGYVSPVYSAVSDANGRLNIDCKSYIAPDGKLIKFDADPTSSAGYERYKFWVEKDTIPDGYQLQYVTGNQVIFPNSGYTITQGGSGSNTIKNTHENWKILLMEKPKESMHKPASENSSQQKGGYLNGKVSWDFQSPVGGVHFSKVANHTVGAEGVTVRASYLSDYAMKQIYSDKVAAMLSVPKSNIRGSGWTARLERQLQDWIKGEVAKDPENWIAETVTAKTDADGSYMIQFKGIWGDMNNANAGLKDYTYKVGDKAGGIKIGNKWTQEQINRLGTLANSASEGSFATGQPIRNEIKHINYDWMFVSIDNAEDLRVMTPYNNNTYASMNSDWGINAGWSVGAVRTGVTNAITAVLRSDFAVATQEIDFHITNYDSKANTAIPGDIAQTSTSGLPNKFGNQKYRISWYDDQDKLVKTGSIQTPSGTGVIESEPFDTTGTDKTKEYTAKLYRVDSNNKNAQLVAVDSFTVEVSHLFISRYDEVNIPKPPVKEMEGAKYYATGLPQDLELTETDGTLKGKAKKAGLYKSNFRTVLEDPSGKLEGSRFRYIAVTDTPLAAGEVGKAYSQDVKPVPEKDPNEKSYVYKMKSVKFISGKEVEGLKVEGDATTGFKITGKPTKVVIATEDVGEGLSGPNIEVIYDIYKTNDQGKEILVATDHIDKVPLVIEKAKISEITNLTQTYDDAKDKQYIEISAKDGTLPTDATYKLVKKNEDGTYIPVESLTSKVVDGKTVFDITDIPSNKFDPNADYYIETKESGKNPSYSDEPIKIDKVVPTFTKDDKGNEINLVQDHFGYKVKISAEANDDAGILRLYAENDKANGYYKQDASEKSAKLSESVQKQLGEAKTFKVTAVDKFGNKTINTKDIEAKMLPVKLRVQRPRIGDKSIFVQADPGIDLEITVYDLDNKVSETIEHTQKSEVDEITLNSPLQKRQKVKVRGTKTGKAKGSVTVRTR